MFAQGAACPFASRSMPRSFNFTILSHNEADLGSSRTISGSSTIISVHFT